MNRALTTMSRRMLATSLALAAKLLLPVCLQAQIVVVVPANSDIDSLSSNQLKLIFQGESSITRSTGLSQIVEFGPAGDEFYELLLKTDSYNMGKRWLRLMFSGARVLPPKRFSKTGQFLRYLKKHENAIGFLPVDAYLSLAADSLRAVVIDGLNHTQARYLLRKPARSRPRE